MLELHHARAEVQHRAGDGVARGDCLVVVDDDLERGGGRRAGERARERRVDQASLQARRRGTGGGDNLARRLAPGHEEQGCGEKKSSHRTSTATLGGRNTGNRPPPWRQNRCRWSTWRQGGRGCGNDATALSRSCQGSASPLVTASTAGHVRRPQDTLPTPGRPPSAFILALRHRRRPCKVSGTRACVRPWRRYSRP